MPSDDNTFIFVHKPRRPVSLRVTEEMHPHVTEEILRRKGKLRYYVNVIRQGGQDNYSAAISFSFLDPEVYHPPIAEIHFFTPTQRKQLLHFLALPQVLFEPVERDVFTFYGKVPYAEIPALVDQWKTGLTEN